MTSPGEESWLDGDAGRLVRPYAVTNGRTRPTAQLELLTEVSAYTNLTPTHLGPDHGQILELCQQPTSVAELAARMRLPAAVTRVLLCDLLDCGAVMARLPHPAGADSSDRLVLEKVLDALQRRL